MAQRLKIDSSLQTRASFEPSTFDAKRGTVDVTFTTGARGRRYSWFDGPYYEELEVSEAAVDLSRLNNGASVLNTHGQYDLEDVIGVVERAWIANGEGHATVRFSDRAEVQPIKQDVQAGILRHISVGYQVNKMEKVEELEKVPVYRVTRWMPTEISLVPVAFDDGAVVRGRQQQEPHEVEITDATHRSEEPHMTTRTNSDGGSTPAAPAVAAPVAAPPPPAASPEDPARAAERAATAEFERSTTIRQVVRRAKLPEALADELISNRAMTIDLARAAVLDRIATESEKVRTEQHTRIDAGEDEREKFRRGVSAALIQRGGVVSIIRAAQKTDVAGAALKDVAFDPGEFRGIRGFHDLARECLERAGVSTRGLGRDELFDKALSRGGYNTTTDFPVVLANVMHKSLLAAYATAPDTWRRICAIRPAQDFRQHNFYRKGSFGTLDAVNESGEFKNKPIPDGERSTYQVGTKGNIIAITRQALIDDDMGVFNNLGAEWGRTAGNTIEADFYALLGLNAGLGPQMLDGQLLFAAAHANIGVQAAISTAAIDADAAVMALQTGVGGVQILDLQPAILLVHRSLRGAAQVINESQYDPDTVANKSQLKPNIVRGLFRDVVASPRLPAGSTRRYLFADPNIAPTFVVAFLDGVETPFLAQQEGFRVDGIEWKVRLDHGVAAVDHRSAVTNAG